MESEGPALPLRFGPWLLQAVSSGAYGGLRWLDGTRTAFRVPWKHNARKDVCSSDLQIFKDWAKASGRYQAEREDPARWKTNFRCALRSTRMFVLLDDRSKSGDDPHKVYGVAGEARRGAGNPAPEDGGRHRTAPPAALPRWPTPTPQLEFDFRDLSLGNTPPTAGTAGAAGPPDGCPHADGLGVEAEPGDGAALDALQWVMQQCDLGHQLPAWADGLYGQEAPGPADAAGLLEAQSVVGDVLLYTESPWEAPAAAPDVGLVPPAAPCPAAPEAALLQGNAGGIPPNLDISIFYRGKLFHHEEVGSSRCLLAYQTVDPAIPLDLTWLVQFPSPASLADQKQRRFTEELLQNTGLLLEQRDNKIYAQRLKKCKVFWALSRQLDVGNLSPKLLCRDQETEIFDFKEFCTELRDFRDYRRERSPDFTIFLCFGQRFSKAKPKESKLILVKLVPKFCEYWYEHVLREGASSLNSGSLSLQLSDSFSLFELIEQYNMQLD
ncbi:interferon regulatory factor 7 [Apteryx rowi]|uniref:interferon regulatory factor 7 n=1 Tax=Apteryx rowi TaxID=308060 RepID=UPI000E1C9C2E|nr:interferon regulatory factor 7 [Apteryx rowi]